MAKPTQTDVPPTSPIAPYIGGKRLLAKRLIARIQAIPHVTYAEPFVGMGGVFLRRNRKPRAEVINDFNGEVSNLFRILQRHYPQFIDTLKYQITARDEFARLVKTDPTTLTDLERAGRFLYLQRTAFGGKVSGNNFGVAADRPARFDIIRLGPMLEDLHARLSGVVIEHLDFESFINKYDKPMTLFYMDPPYYGCESDYGRELFKRADFTRMAKRLRKLKGRFLLSLNDTPEVRDIFKGFEIEAVLTSYSIAKNNGKKVGEVIISGGV